MASLLQQARAAVTQKMQPSSTSLEGTSGSQLQLEQASQRLWGLWSPGVTLEDAERVCQEMIDPNCQIIGFAPNGDTLTGPNGYLSFWKATHDSFPGEPIFVYYRYHDSISIVAIVRFHCVPLEGGAVPLISSCYSTIAHTRSRECTSTDNIKLTPLYLVYILAPTQSHYCRVRMG